MRMMVSAVAAAPGVVACGEEKAADPAPAPKEAAMPAGALGAARSVINVPPPEVGAKLAGKWQAIDDRERAPDRLR